MPADSNNVNARDGASIVWGPEIRVDGKRPEWLQANDFIDWQWESLRWHADRPDEPWNARGMPADRVAIENGVVAIRLRANHPHYRQPTTPERDPALWDRMVALVRRMCHVYVQTDRAEYPDYAEARSIVADLPKPVDPDMLVAKELAEKHAEATGWQFADEKAPLVEALLDALRRGRELATPEVSHVG